jgi:hypothetical protein
MIKLYSILLLTFALFSMRANACNCNSGASVEASVKAADYIVRVKILSVKYTDRLDTLNVVADGDPRNIFSKYWKFQVKVYQAKVITIYKGVLQSDTISIVTGLNPAACEMRMDLEMEYLVYGFKKDYLGFASIQRKASDGKLFWTNNCTRSWNYTDEEALVIKEEVLSQSYRQ